LNLLRIVCLLFAGLVPPAALAGEYKEVACDQLHVQIDGEGIPSECQAGQHRQESWGATSEVLFAEELWGFTVIHKTVMDGHSLMYKQGALKAAGSLSELEIRDWSDAARLAGYTVHRFRTSSRLSFDSSCFYFERYEQANRGGYRARIVGMSCTSDPAPIDDATAAAMLQRIVLQ
jgi:hypothetical protein